ncbi:MAG: OmpA family protein [Bacteroidota bacterium]
MNLATKVFALLLLSLSLSACVSKKKFTNLQSQLDIANRQVGECGQSLNDYMNRLSSCEQEKVQIEGDLKQARSTIDLRQEQIGDLREQLADLRKQRDQQVSQVGDLTVLSQAANENMKESLAQLGQKDEYIQLLQAARTKADSINLALAVNLKSVLRDGIADEDVEVKVDKTVVYINLSDKMLFRSGSASLTERAAQVLAKIAQIVQSRSEVDVMVEGYTDSDPIKTDCLSDNWDLSVKRSTAVVRVLQNDYGVDPNKLIAAGRGEYNALASNDTPEGKATNRRTRIIILPKLDQFYDLLNPEMVKR